MTRNNFLDIASDLDKYVLFMKVGYHISEGIDDIYSRKKGEDIKAGRVFWGYRGNLCHPQRQVIPFASLAAQEESRVIVAMILTTSKFKSESVSAQEFSLDRINWHPIPAGINVLGSQYALVCSQLRKVEAQVNLSQYEVAVGPSKGCTLSNYLRYRVDKACAVRKANSSMYAVRLVRVSFLAELIEPYAVFLRCSR